MLLKRELENCQKDLLLCTQTQERSPVEIYGPVIFVVNVSVCRGVLALERIRKGFPGAERMEGVTRIEQISTTRKRSNTRPNIHLPVQKSREGLHDLNLSFSSL